MNQKNEFRKYVLLNSLLGLGMANGVLTVIVFYMKNHSAQQIFATEQLMNEMILTSIVIGISVTVIGAVFTNRDIKKGKITKQPKRRLLDQLIPTVKPFRAIYITAFTTCVTTLLAKMIFVITGASDWGFTESMLLIFILSTFASAVTAYLSITKASQISIEA